MKEGMDSSAMNVLLCRSSASEMKRSSYKLPLKKYVEDEFLGRNGGRRKMTRLKPTPYYVMDFSMESCSSMYQDCNKPIFQQLLSGHKRKVNNIYLVNEKQ